MYDLIGDIHGHAAALEALLQKLQYTKIDGVWQHPKRKAVFVGDYIDRGPAIRETLQIVRSMSDKGHAVALMGNHEYNALAFAHLHNGGYLRPHSTKHIHQHSATLEQFKDHQQEWESYLQWFYELNLYLDEPEVRAIHACWDQSHIDWLKVKGYDRMSAELLIHSHNKSRKEYEVINDLLKGKEFNIPEQYAWKDKDGHTRNSNRVKWWKQPKGSSFGDFLFNCPDTIENELIPEDIDIVIYDSDAPPVFFGHYWLEDLYPIIQSSNVVCLDYSIAKGGSLVAYSWNGEKQLNPEHFTYVRTPA